MMFCIFWIFNSLPKFFDLVHIFFNRVPFSGWFWTVLIEHFCNCFHFCEAQFNVSPNIKELTQQKKEQKKNISKP